MKPIHTFRRCAWVLVLTATGALTLPVFVPAAGAGTNTAKVTAGLVDVNTNLAYENAAGAGSGIVLSAKGEVLTNNHVIEGETTIQVVDVGNGRTYTASVVGYDVPADVAVLQLKGASGLKTAPIGNSSSVKQGASVVAIGNAGGVGGTPSSTTGTVVAVNQSITASDALSGSSEQLSGLIEMNAAIQPGDSGGALVNSSGEVIGMITAGSSSFAFQPGGSEGFAITVNTATTIAREIESGEFGGNVHRSATAFLGIQVASSGYFRRGFYQPGALILGVVPASPAEQAGLVPGDVITSIGSQSIASPTTLTNTLLAKSPGTKVQIGWVDRSGATHSASVTLASGPPQ